MLMERKLACDVYDSGEVSEYGIPVVAEFGASNERYIQLLGVQFGWSFKQIKDNIFENQYGAKFTICNFEE